MKINVKMVLLTLLLFPILIQAQDFEVDKVKSVSLPVAGEITIVASTIGKPPKDSSMLIDRERWRILAKAGNSPNRPARKPIFISYNDTVKQVTLKVKEEDFAGINLAGAKLTIVFSAETFGLILVNASEVSGPNVIISVLHKGPPHPLFRILTPAPEFWRLIVTSSGDKPLQRTATPSKAEYNGSLKTIILTVPLANLVGIVQPEEASWKVDFLTPERIFTATQEEKKKEGSFISAKARKDADFYLAGSYLTGVATKPIWMIDLKAGYSDIVSNIPLISSLIPIKSANVRAGIYTELSTNTDGKPPNDRTEIDPDSIRAYAKFSGIRQVSWGPLYGLKWEIQPAGGEFSRQTTSSNIVAGGKLRFIMTFPNQRFNLIPLIGTELGQNLNKPRKLFDRTVDLSHYDGIRRALAGAEANHYVFRRIVTEDDPYSFVFGVSWVARVPFSVEPFTRTEFLPDKAGNIKRQKVVSLRQNTRHYVEATATWNTTKLLGFQLQYKYGSQPPLFQFVNHQVTIGLVLKGKFAGSHSSQDP